MHEITNKVDFYITNVCNLTCDNCNRFNNHDFRGWQRWSDYESTYEQWGQLTQLRAVTIMGGEPFLNPTLADWIKGINRVFGIEVQVLTNGTRFKQSAHLYNTMLYRSPHTGALNHIGVSLHNLNDQEEILNDIRNFLQAPIKEYTKTDANNFWNSDWFFIDTNGVMVNVYVVNQFGRSSIQSAVDAPGRFFLHDSDPVAAHQSCAFVQYKSYHFIRGKLYKCGPVALMPEFDQQHQLDISTADRQLLNSYKALSTDNFDQYHKEFFDHIDKPIPQCKFCPSKSEFKMIAPIRKGL
jgi:hypothetical protein